MLNEAAVIYKIDVQKDPQREEWHLFLHDGTGRPEGRSYVCSALSWTETQILEAVCEGTEAGDIQEAYRLMMSRMTSLDFS
jgi:hypothetical protein